MPSPDLPLTRRVNQEPTVMLGLNGSELAALSAAATLFWFPAGFLIALAMGAWPLGFVLGMLGAIASVSLAGMILKQVKRQRPNGYYQQRIQIAMQSLATRIQPALTGRRLRAHDLRIITHQGYWLTRHYQDRPRSGKEGK